MSDRIEGVYVIVGDDDAGGIPSFRNGSILMPLIAADPQRLRLIKEVAQRIADSTGQDFKVVRFSVREDIGEIKSKKV